MKKLTTSTFISILVLLTLPNPISLHPLSAVAADLIHVDGPSGASQMDIRVDGRITIQNFPKETFTTDARNDYEHGPFKELALQTVAGEYIYVAQDALGDDSGADPANAHSIQWFHNAANWSSVVADDGLIGPEDTVFFYGDITERIILRGDGTEVAEIVFDGSQAVFRETFFGNAKDYYRLTNFTFDITNSEEKVVIRLANDNQNHASHVSITNGRILAAAPGQGGINAQYSEYVLIENNMLHDVSLGIVTQRKTTHDITIRNNEIIDPNDDAGTEYQTDNIFLADAYNVLVEGNRLVIRSHSESRNDNIEIFKSGSSDSANPKDITIRYNRIEMETDYIGDGRSWTMIENMTGYLKIYGNVFVGRPGCSAPNGMAIHDQLPDLQAYIYNNTYYVHDSGPNAGIAWRDPGTLYFYNNAVVYPDGSGLNVLKSPFPEVPNRDYNLYFGGAWWPVTSLDNWLAGEPHSIGHLAPKFKAPEQDDYSPLATSPLVGKGLDLGPEYAKGLKPGTTFPAPELVARPQGAGWDIGAYEFVPALELSGTPANQAIHLGWEVNTTLPLTTSWTITYEGTPGKPPSPITDIREPTRAYSLTNLTNNELYTITLTTIGVTPTLSDTISVMPTDKLLYLPLITR